LAVGRCSGCGRTGSAARVKNHIISCQEYLALFRSRPAECRDPETEYQCFTAVSQDETSAERRDVRLRERFVEMARLQGIEAQRWRQPRDILED